MDKPCQVYGNFHNGNHGMKCGTLGLYRSLPPLNRTPYIKTWGTLNPGFSVYHTVSEAERKTVQCMVDSSEKGNADIIKSDSGRVQNRVHVEAASTSLRQPLSALPGSGI